MLFDIVAGAHPRSSFRPIVFLYEECVSKKTFYREGVACDVVVAALMVGVVGLVAALTA